MNGEIKMKVRIVDLPISDFPEWVNKSFIGLELDGEYVDKEDIYINFKKGDIIKALPEEAANWYLTEYGEDFNYRDPFYICASVCEVIKE